MAGISYLSALLALSCLAQVYGQFNIQQWNGFYNQPQISQPKPRSVEGADYSQAIERAYSNVDASYDATLEEIEEASQEAIAVSTQYRSALDLLGSNMQDVCSMSMPEIINGYSQVSDIMSFHYCAESVINGGLGNAQNYLEEAYSCIVEADSCMQDAIDFVSMQASQINIQAQQQIAQKCQQVATCCAYNPFSTECQEAQYQLQCIADEPALEYNSLFGDLQNHQDLHLGTVAACYVKAEEAQQCLRNEMRQNIYGCYC